MPGGKRGTQLICKSAQDQTIATPIATGPFLCLTTSAWQDSEEESPRKGAAAAKARTGRTACLCDWHLALSILEQAHANRSILACSQRQTKTMTSTASAQVQPTSNVGPLPSTTPPSACAQLGISEAYHLLVHSSTTTSYLTLRRDFADVYWNGYETVTCLPPSYRQGVHDALSPVFSPATACPYGYAPKCTFVATGATLTAGPSVSFWPALAPSDVAIGCCPR